VSAQVPSELTGIEALLRRSAAAFRYPPTPAIAAVVAARLREAGAAPGGSFFGTAARLWSRRLPRAALALAAAAAVAIIVSIAVPQSRSALADFFRLSHVRVEREPAVGPTPPALSPESFARPATLADARAAVDFPVRSPVEDGETLEPDAVYLQGESSTAPVVIFVFEDDEFDLYQTRAGIFGKGGPDPSLIHEIEFGGHPALWIDEGGHIATFLDELGRVVVETRRTVDRATLLWEEEGITYRLETPLSQEEAIRIAESLR
jgi:hypothetical protein